MANEWSLHWSCFQAHYLSVVSLFHLPLDPNSLPTFKNFISNIYDGIVVEILGVREVKGLFIIFFKASATRAKLVRLAHYSRKFGETNHIFLKNGL
jgi:hypothetical protein